MFRETRIGVKVGSHQECEPKEPTNIHNTIRQGPLLLWFFFSGLVCSDPTCSPSFPIVDLSGGFGAKIRAIQMVRFPTIPEFVLGHVNFPVIARRIS
jgi:hypothetical protein